MIGSDHAWNGVHIPFPERFPSLGHLTELLSEPTVERVSKVTPATDQIEGDQHGTEAKEGQQSGLVSKGSKRNKSALADLTYPPLNVLKPVCRDIWIVDGPLIGFGALGIRLPFPTRMTIVRLEGRLFIHSPTVLSPTLRAAINELGTPQWIIGPNTIHYWWVGEWKRAFPNACVFLAPDIPKRAKRRVDYPFVTLDHDTAWPWCHQLKTWVIRGNGITEVDFFHHASKTLILTDLIENFEADKIGSRWMRWLIRLGGTLDPFGGMPRDMRLAYWRNRERLRAAVQEMIALAPHRVILAHGRWYRNDGTAQLRRAFHWLLPGGPTAEPIPKPQ